MQNILIYKSELLPMSETFILAQLQGLKRYYPVLAGLLHSERSLPIPEDAIVLAREPSLAAKVENRLFRETGFSPSLLKRMRRVNPVLIHAHFGFEGALALPLAAALDVPLMVTLHGCDVTIREEFHATSADGSIYLRRRPKLADRASVFICISDYIRRKAISFGFPEEKLLVHYIGIDLTKFQASQESREPGLVLFVGRLVEKKGCAHLVRAMARVRSAVPDARLVVLGDGALRPSLEALASELGISCQFLGAQPANVVRDWMRRASVFCGPSVTAANGDGEGLGLVFCEALATGTPVATFDTGGVGEVILHEDTGLLAPERDEEALAQNIVRLLSDRTLWSRCRERGLARVRDKFDLHKQCQILESIYDGVIEGKEVVSLA